MNQFPAASQSFANATRGLRHVFVRNLALPASIGIHPHERTSKQIILVSIDASVAEQHAQQHTQQHAQQHSGNEQIEDVVCYESLCREVATIVANGHIDLVETLADRIADRLLVDKRIVQLQVQVEKPAAIETAESVGITIERLQGA